MKRLGRATILILLWGVIVTCARITVNIYFPAAEIKDAATQIEKEVRQEEPAPGESNPMPPATPPAPQSRAKSWPSYRWARLRFSVATAQAQTVNINITTPSIRRLIKSRQQRFPQLVPLFAAGALGENNQGLVDLRALDKLSLQDRARAKTLQQQENRDRQQLYQELAEANKIPPDRTRDIAVIFAEVNRKEARSGWWIQESNGNWKKK
jgi:uncharacterized protein YdbL (DUF1318 family)